MLVQFGQTVVRNNQTLPLQIVQQPLKVTFEGDPNQLYTLIFYDLSSPHGIYMHYQISNIKGGDISKGNLIFKYQPPKPQANTGRHSYVIEINKQDRILPSEENKGGRAPVPLETLRLVAGLTPIDRLDFQVPSPGSMNDPHASSVAGYNYGCNVSRPILVTGQNCGCGRKPQPIVTGSNNNQEAVTRGLNEGLTLLDFNRGDSLNRNSSRGFYDQNRNYPELSNGFSSKNNKDWFLPDAPLSDTDRSYCRCTMEVAANQPSECNLGKVSPGQKSNEGRRCVNPYAVCHSSVRGEGGFPDCTRYLDFTKIPDRELLGYVSSRKMAYPVLTETDYNRAALIQKLEDWRREKQAQSF